MDILNIIDKKRIGLELTKEEISFMVNGFLDGNVKDYQMSAFLMAITINGMTDEETINLTDIMLRSGEVLDTSKINGFVVDKHSTGGIGDKVTFVLCPLLASFGLKIAKMSGRGLGFTGGTIDKLESIPKVRVALDEEEFIKQVNDIGIAISSPNQKLDVADKKIYALRDVTSTVSSIPLIASSIMSKKLACNADLILIDVKVGNGALMKNKDMAIKLANMLSKIGKHFNKKVICVLTNMDQPLGCAIGNALEIKEAMMLLQGSGPGDVLELVISLATIVIALTKQVTIDEARNMAFKHINNGKAYQKFKEFIEYQNGDINSLIISPNVISIKSTKEGYINYIDSQKLGSLINLLGAGRQKEDDIIDYSVGAVLTKKVGDYVNKNDELIRLYINQKEVDIKDIIECFKIEEKLKKPNKLIFQVIK